MLRLEQIALTIFLLESIHHASNERANRLFLFFHCQVEFLREVSQQKFFAGVMINNRGCQTALVATVWAAKHIHAATQEALLGLRVAIHVKELLHIGLDGLLAIGTLGLGQGH